MCVCVLFDSIKFNHFSLSMRSHVFSFICLSICGDGEFETGDVGDYQSQTLTEHTLREADSGREREGEREPPSPFVLDIRTPARLR